MWVGGGGYPAPSHPNRTGGSPASGFPVSGLPMDWLRHSTQGVRKSRTSRAVVAHPLTPTGRSTVRFPAQPQPGCPARSGAQPCGTTRTLVREVGSGPQHHFPTSLRSTVVTRFCATTDALTPAGPFSAASRGSLIHVTGTSDHSISNHLRFSTSRVHSLSAGSSILFGLRLDARRLARTADRIEFTLPACLGGRRYGLVVRFPLLSTRGSRPDAVTFRYWPFSVGQVRDFHPAVPVRSQAHEHTPPACGGGVPPKPSLPLTPRPRRKIMGGTIFRRDAGKHTPEAYAPHSCFVIRV